MELFKGLLVSNVHIEHHAEGYGQGKAENVDECERFVLHQIPPCDFEIILKHGQDSYWLINGEIG